MGALAVERKAQQVAPAKSIAQAVRDILSVPNAELDYARAKLALDALVDPSLDADWAMAELDRLADRARRMAGQQPDDAAKLNALRTLIYKSGPWNGHRPFAYDHSNLRGGNVRVKLLSHYLKARLGDCVSMPVLFLILAERLGLQVALANAPQHMFVRHLHADGSHTNLEATSGANPSREVWYRRIMPVSDRAIESGFCFRTLSRREGVALMATVVLQHLRDCGRHEEIPEVASIILRHNPTDAFTKVAEGQAYFQMIGNEFLNRYRSSFLIPLHLRPRYDLLLARNRAAFAAAFALGWEGPI